MSRFGCLLDPKDYPGTCYSCQHYEDYGPVAGRFGKYNGRCKVDKHETDALVPCKINAYESIFSQRLDRSTCIC